MTRLLLVFGIVFFAGGCATTDTVEVTIHNLAFEPRDLTVVAGTEVIWLYEDGGTFHDVIVEHLGVNAGFRQ